MEFEDILLDVGDGGRYQNELILFFLLPSATLLPWFSMNVLFMVSVPEHWCNVPEVVRSNLTIEQQRDLISPPANPKCHMYDINYTDYLTSGIYTVPNDTTTRPCSNGWEYDKTNYDSTAATQWNMFCEDDHYTSFVLTLYNVGSIIGTPIYGSLSDRIGRKISFFITLTVTALSAVASVLMTDFTAFVIIKTINGSLMPSIFQLPYIIILELVAPEMRTHMNGLVNCAWTVGMCFLPLIAYLTRSWVTLGLVTSSVTFIFFIYWTYLPESPRWLLSQERYDETLVIMKKIAHKNGKSIDPDQLLSKLKTLGERIKKEKTVDNVKNSSTDLLRYPQLRKIFIVISLCWVADVMSYYGLQLNVSNLAGNEFINFFLTAIVEIPGYLTSWFLMDKFGRRWCTVGTFLMLGFICLVPAFVSGLPYADITCSMLGKFCSAAAFMATYQQSSELYPTVVRSLGMGMSSTVSMTISLAVPYLIYLSVYGKAIPFVVIGFTAIVAGFSAAFLPETLNENLPQTISDAEEFGKNQKFFSWNRRKKSISRQRAASLALQMKGFDNKGMKDEDVKIKPISSLFHNKDFLNSKTPEISNEFEKKSEQYHTRF